MTCSLPDLYVIERGNESNCSSDADRSGDYLKVFANSIERGRNTLSIGQLNICRASEIK
jgi:hypothetical protein